MAIRKRTLWRVPVFCSVMGLAACEVVPLLLVRFSMIWQPDGTLKVYEIRTLLIYGAIFAGTLLLGGLVFFRGMSRRELFWSASIMVVFQAAAVIIWALRLAAGPAAVFFVYAADLSEWSRFLTKLLPSAIGNSLACKLLLSLSPYLFVPFGRRSQRS